MKSLKKFLALALALALCFVMALPAMAAGGTDFTLEISPAANPKHTYTIYQIFTGDISGQSPDYILSNVQYGMSYNGKSGAVPETELEKFEEGGSYYNNAEAFADYFNDGDNGVKGEAFHQKENADDITETVYDSWDGSVIKVPAGYYLIVDNGRYVDPDDPDDTNDKENDANSAYIVQVVGPTTIAPKSTVPELDKKTEVTDPNGNTTLTDAAGHQIGEVFPFVITAKIPAEHLTKYDEYGMTIKDTLGEGLSFDNGFEIYLNNSDTKLELEGQENIVLPTIAKGDSGAFEVKIKNLFAVPGVKTTEGGLNTVTETVDGKSVDYVIVKLKYWAYLNEKSEVTLEGGDGAEENKNKAKLEYTNDPEWNGDGTPPTGETPESPVTIYTFGINGNKTDEKGESLAGAKFKLYKDGNEVTIYTKDGRYMAPDPKDTEYITKLTDNGWKQLGSDTPDDASDDNVIVTDEKTGNNLVIDGLSAGTYVLKEIEAPENYNKVQDIQIDVVPTYFTDNGVQKVELKVTSKYLVTPNVAGEEKEINTNVNNTEVTVVNKEGTLLPSTGGIGTTIFYAAGGALVVGAGVLLFVKKRMGSKG